ncbi:DUF1254 domain-containing protein [Microbulbifer pacificus]|uniref:DUF1254 domain-containing protein n=1 Tax=Microbulbifer pacificus TaxID=407164 RepID=UPI000CF3A13E|nr:DUF1254 domain-containing protein [Microbulbifer pacificus]
MLRNFIYTAVLSAVATNAFADTPKYKMTTDMPASITTPDTVETSAGTFRFFDGVPDLKSVQTAYDVLDRMRGTEAYITGLPTASAYALYTGPKAIGWERPNQIQLFKDLLDSTALILTGNTSTLYAISTLDLKTDGATVIEIPPGMLGALDSAWFKFIGNFGPAGQDKGKGGKYLVLPPGYKGDVPNGYFILKAPTYRNWLFLRGSIAKGLKPAVENIEKHLRVYPLAKASNPPATEFINASGKQMNTIPANDFSFYEQLNAAVQYEPIDSLDPVTRGLYASIGIVKDKPFKPDARMRRLLTDAVAIGNAIARANTFYPRNKGNYIYGEGSGWVMGYADKNTTFTYSGAYDSMAAAFFHYNAIGVTPAMALTRPGAGSDYGINGTDSKKRALDGSKTYRLRLPPNVPVKDFWAVTIYDTQTRSLLQTDQQFPTVGSQTEGMQKNTDGSYDIYFSPKPPQGKEGNWLQTIPGKSWMIILRMYGPQEAWIDKTWRPGEIELME